MIKNWVEYIKESFEKLTHTEYDVYKYTLDLLESEIDSIFVDVHQQFNTSSGDITPDQVMELEQLKEKLAKLISKQVTSNIELKNQKSDLIDLEELSQLEDESLEVKEGDEVIAVYSETSYIKNVYKFTVERKKGSFGRPEDVLGGYKQSPKKVWYSLSDADLVVKVDTYNDFVKPSYRL